MKNNTKKNNFIIGSVLMMLIISVISLSGCVNNTENENALASIHAYVGAGMQQPMDEIAVEFEKKYNIKVNYDYSGSGALYSKITASNKGDIYMPGAYFYIEKLDKEGKIINYTNITKHIPVIVVKNGNPKNITSIKDLEKENIKISLGEENIAIGRTFKKILKNAENDNPNMTQKIEKNVVVRGATVKQALMYVELNQADAAVVWRADAIASDKVSIIPIDSKYNTIKTVPIGILSLTKNRKNAELFYNFVNNEGKAIFKKYGFEIIDN
ncbi:molybdate ABC transporter substrate-binding protein [Methanococcus aeolicus]|uniref:molybdate ABC transporter substrate-binding protein n=1 Tax=Methanococcus aeolicus TaxID=42879 RepID=UPI0021C7C79E|nr:molybdate ABC transporter substrate-binding protein [Methanococcus aeolicus]UXM84998.1 molybdate ABC transporter substrate-binding protein [Methanococcus aeolicus]